MEILKKTAAFRVQKQTEGRADEEVTSISLSGVPVLPELWTRYTHLTHLLLVCMKPKLTGMDLIGLAHLPSLRLLDVSDNAVTVLVAPPRLPSLARLLMPNNKVNTLAETDRLAESFPNLEVLDVVDNAVDTPAHFAEIFAKFPQLVALNSKTKDGAEVVVEDSDESGSEEEDDSDEEEDDSDDSDGSEGSGASESESEADAPQPKRQRQEEAAAGDDGTA